MQNLTIISLASFTIEPPVFIISFRVMKHLKKYTFLHFIHIIKFLKSK